MGVDSLSGGDEPLQVDVSCIIAVEGLVAGDRDAIAVIYERFIDLLVNTAIKKLPATLQVKVDPASVVDSVLESLMVMRPELRHNIARYEIRNWGQLFGLLALMVARRASNRVRKFKSEGRNADRDQPLAETPLPSNEPSPQDVALLTDLLEQLQKIFDTEQWAIVTLLLDGHSVRETAEKADRTTTYVRTVREKLAAKLKKLTQSNDGSE